MTRPIRVLQVSSAFNDDAPAQGATALARYLNPGEFHVTAVSLRALLDQISTTVADLNNSRISHRSMEMTSFLDARVLTRLIRCIRTARADIVHTHAFRADIWAGFAAKLARVPVFVTSIRGNDWDLFVGGQPYPVALIAMAGSKIATSLADAIVAVSEGVRDHLVKVQKISPSKIRVIPNGVDLERLGRLRTFGTCIREELNLPPEAPLVGTLAVMKPWKGLSYLVDAARLVLLQHRDVHFLLAGDGSERRAIENQVRDLAITENVHLLGYRRDAIALLEALDIYVLPSLLEGFPRSVLEAMALGKPVVVTDIGGSRETVRHGASGWVVPPRDSRELARAICRLLESSGLRRSLGAEGRRAVEQRFSARVIAETHERLYRELLQAKGIY